MTEEELMKAEETLRKSIEFYTGRKLQKVDEKRLNDSYNSVLAWDEAGRPFDHEMVIPGPISALPIIGPVNTQKKPQKNAES